MRKKFLTIALGVMMSVSMAACGSQSSPASSGTVSDAASSADSTTTSSAAESLVGGWETNQGSTDPDDSANSAAKAAFEKATENLEGYDYTLVAYLGSQVVSGTNYSFLVKGTPVTPDAQSEYLIAVVYEDLDGNATITGTKSLLDVPADEEAAGGWSYNQGETSLDSNADVKDAFDKAVENMDGADYAPVAYIGSQVVSGTNYAVLCKVTPVTPDAEGTFDLVTVYEDLDGNTEVTEVTDVDLSAGAYDAASSGAESAAQ